MKPYMLLLLLLLPVSFVLLPQDNQHAVVAAEIIQESQAGNKVFIPIIANNSSFINWTFEETFDGDPASPSQDLLPDSFDYVVTHRTLPAKHFRAFDSYLADHDDHCAGPNPTVSPLPAHHVVTSHESNGDLPDRSFFICKNHMMSSMGEVEGYSVTAFWPRQEFDFKDGGYLEFEVNINDRHPRSWFEVLIVPRAELKVGSAPWYLPIDEVYPKDRIVLRYFFDYKRSIAVGTGGLDPYGVITEQTEGSPWRTKYPSDPALNDRTIRRTMRVSFFDNKIIWSIEKANGTFDDFAVNVPGGFPFTRGLVVFKTHAYTPEKEGNTDAYTFHWDNIRFTGPVVGRYENFEADDVVDLQANGDRPIGDRKSVTIDLPNIGPNPVMFGQVHNPMSGQVLLSVNGRSNIVVNPYDYNPGTCASEGWKSFQLKINPAWLVQGTNTFTWTVGPRPAGCVEDWVWSGFSIKDLEMQFDVAN